MELLLAALQRNLRARGHGCLPDDIEQALFYEDDRNFSWRVRLHSDGSATIQFTNGVRCPQTVEGVAAQLHRWKRIPTVRGY